MTSHDQRPSPAPQDATDAKLGIRGEQESSGSQAVSHDTPMRRTPDTGTGKDAGHTARHDKDAQFKNRQEAGNITPVPALEPPAGDQPPARDDLAVTFKRRMESEGRWREVSLVRDRMMVETKQAIPDKEARRAWVYAELDRMYPPREQCTEVSDLIRKLPDAPPASASDSGAIQGLADLPGDWPDLPANAVLSSEVGWVQANRLRVVDERPGRATRVRLDLALGPAPSWAALGWLETSIRSYAKFVDVAAKVSGGQEDEGAVMRRERKSIEEVRAMMQEMMDAEGTCPHCGRPY